MKKLEVHGARQNNLKGFSLDIQRGALTVFTGVSGSGKSSLAFDTIYAEGYRRYMDSLSISARTFMEQMPRPDVDSIEGLSPAVAISQRLSRPSPRATVATVTEISAYLRLLFAHEGTPWCLGCNRPLKAWSRAAIVDSVLANPEGSRVIVLAPLVRGREGDHGEVLRSYAREGFIRLRVDGQYMEVPDLQPLDPKVPHDIEGVIDRLVVRQGVRERLAESLDTALRLGSGVVMFDISASRDAPSRIDYMGVRASCPQCQAVFPEVRPSLFSPNSAHGMCRTCNGLGKVTDIRPDAVITSPEKGLLQGAVGPLNSDDGLPEPKYLPPLRRFLKLFKLDGATPVREYPQEARDALLLGIPAEGRVDSPFEGLIHFLSRNRAQSLGDETVCPACGGCGLRDEARSVLLNGTDIASLCAREVSQVQEFFDSLDLSISRMQTVKTELTARVAYLVKVGLHYLTLDRRADTLSGGELQRIRLATQIGGNLSGVIYVLDEPTIGLHPSDTRNLLDALGSFMANDNTVVVVEHDREVIESAQRVLEIGPGAGIHGGDIVFDGTVADMKQCPASLTGAYLSGSKRVSIPTNSDLAPLSCFTIHNASKHNLQDLTVSFPLRALSCVVGPSGAGKSTLVCDVLYRCARQALEGNGPAASGARVTGLRGISFVSLVDSAPLKRSQRSNVMTYIGLATLLRAVFASTPEAKMRGYGPSWFSPNNRSGRCESCAGTGTRRLEMVFLPDMFVPCEDCGGTGFNREVLEIRFKGLNFAEVLQLEAAQAEKMFAGMARIRRPLSLLREIGLGYLRLGQSATTFSGGEAQRVRLAAALVGSGRNTGMFILDEPTIGLHFEDIDRLLLLLRKLTEKGHTVVAVEHDTEFVSCCDHVVELGPGGGREGGLLMGQGRPQDIAMLDTATGRELRRYLG